MAELKANLTKKDQKNRDFILNGSMWKVVMVICIPLAIYQSLNQIFKVLDAKMAAHISSESVSAVVYLSQIQMMLAAIGAGLAIGASLKISEAYGQGDYKLVRQRVSSLYAMCAVLGAIIIVGIIPFTEQFLKMANTPADLISVGKTYFNVELLALVFMFFNNVYMSIERARGNSKRILYINIFGIVLKLSITAVFVYVLNGNITMIAVATLLSQIILFILALFYIYGKDNAFGFSMRAVRLNKEICGPMLNRSYPVVIEKVAFSLGKVMVNSMSTDYGSLTVGALGISNNIGGLTTCPQLGFQEGAAAIISQNLGAKKYDRALDAFKKVLIANVIIGFVGFLSTLYYLDFISGLFAEGDMVFKALVEDIYRYEAFGAVTLGINSSVIALLYGYGMMKWTLFINFSRVFVFRIPVLWFLQNFTGMGAESVGVVMLVSNISVGVVASIIAFIVIRRIKKGSIY